MPGQFPDACVDLETTGLNQSRNAIIQIAAVRFNLAERTIDHDFFDQCLIPPMNRFWDENTRIWWSSKREILESIYARMRPTETVLLEFEAWAKKTQQPVFWGKPTHFDHSFLGSYFQDYGMQHPFFYRHANDCNSFIRARYWPAVPPKWEYILPQSGPVHSALFDCLHQIAVLFRVADDTEGKFNLKPWIEREEFEKLAALQAVVMPPAPKPEWVAVDLGSEPSISVSLSAGTTIEVNNAIQRKEEKESSDIEDAAGPASSV